MCSWPFCQGWEVWVPHLSGVVPGVHHQRKEHSYGSGKDQGSFLTGPLPPLPALWCLLSQPTPLNSPFSSSREGVWSGETLIHIFLHSHLEVGGVSDSRPGAVLSQQSAEDWRLCFIFPQVVSCRKKLWHWQLGAIIRQANLEGVEALVGGSGATVCGLDRPQESGVHSLSQKTETPIRPGGSCSSPASTSHYPTKNIKPDALSRQFQSESSPAHPEDLPTCFVCAITWSIENKVKQSHFPAPSTCPTNHLFVPAHLQSQVLQWDHSSRLACHPGILFHSPPYHWLYHGLMILCLAPFWICLPDLTVYLVLTLACLLTKANLSFYGNLSACELYFWVLSCRVSEPLEPLKLIHSAVHCINIGFVITSKHIRTHTGFSAT